MDDEIRTARLLMRRFRLGDTRQMHLILSNPEATRFWSTLPHETVEQTEDWVRSEVVSPAELIDDFVLTLNGTLIGKLGCWRLPEIGFILDPAVWGRGYAREALNAYIGHRRRRGGKEITADVDPANVTSLRLLEGAGFTETGRASRTWNLGGEWRDSVYLRLDL